MGLNARITTLKVAAFALLIGPGLIMITGPISPLMSWVEAFLDLAYQPLNGLEKVNENAALLLNAILGGVLAGFGVMIWLVADRVYRQDQALGRSLILIPLCCWFLCDSLGSILAGAWFNAVINIAILAAFLLPLILPSSNAKTVSS